MNRVIRKFHVSCPEFGGYTHKIYMNNIETLQEIVDIVLSKLRETLVDLGLETLYKRLDEMKPRYHIHDFSVVDIIMIDRQYYVCHCRSAS